MVKRYLEIDSTYRDRNRFSNPSDFEIPISQTGVRDRFTALDPVSLSTPLTIFDGSFRNDSSSDTITGITIKSLGLTIPISVLSAEDQNINILIGTIDPIKLKREYNFYAGSSLELDYGTFKEYRRIESYEYIGFFPNTFISLLIGFADIDLGRMIISEPFSLPISQGLSLKIVNSSFTIPSIPYSYIFIPYGVPVDNYYINCILEDTTIGVSRKIVSYTGATRLAKTDLPFPAGWQETDSYLIRKESVSESGTLIGLTTTTLQFPATSSSELNHYTGDFIRITSGILSGEIRKITYYTGSTRIASVDLAYSSIPGTVTYEILPFTRDNVVPLVFTGSELNKTDFYDIELINLILPNISIISGNGGNPITYPYFLVELYNISVASGDNRNILISNNPNSVRVLFRVPMDDKSLKSVSPFIKVDGDGITQTIKFRPDQTIRFRVLLPNGDLYLTHNTEFLSPSLPNEFKQISACFSLQRR
jgi:hypothetical protein